MKVIVGKKNCLYCGNEFDLDKYYLKQKFCSNSCRGKWQYQHGKNLPPLQNGAIPWNKNLTQDDDRRLKKLSEDRTGDKNWMWKNGITKLVDRIRDSHKSIKWRKEVFKRDNYTCQDCNENGYLEAHHIKSFALILEENNIKTLKEALDCKELWDINNGITLCTKCHKLTDNYGNKKRI